MMMLFLFSACSDQNTNLLYNDVPPLSNRNTIEVLNGVLNFATYSEFEQFQEDLRLKELDTLLIKSAYQALGINLQVGFPILTDHPICLLEENSLSGFVSKRKIEEDLINNRIERGEDMFSIIFLPYLKTALNQNGSVKIGTRIFTFYDNLGVSIVLNEDWELYDSIKLMPFEDLKMEANLYVTEYDKGIWTDLYYYDTNGEIIGEKPFSFPNPPQESSVACDFSHLMKVAILTDGIVRIELPGGNYDKYEWTFSNGTTMNGTNTVIYNYDPKGWVRLCVLMYEPNNPSGVRQVCCGTVYLRECGIRGFIGDAVEDSGINRRIEASIWATATELGTTTKVLSKSLGRWRPVSGNILASFNSVAFESKLSTCTPHFLSETETRIAARNVSAMASPANNLYAEKGSHSSSNTVNVGNMLFGFGVSGIPKLKLE